MWNVSVVNLTITQNFLFYTTDLGKIFTNGDGVLESRNVEGIFPIGWCLLRSPVIQLALGDWVKKVL